MGMPLSALMRITLRSLWGNGVRSGLTLLGVFMGVSAVNATLNIQSITQAQLEQKLAERDRPYIQPYVYSETDSPVLNEADQKAFRQAIPYIRSISQVGSIYGLQSIQFNGDPIKDVNVDSVSLNYLETTGRKMLQGRFFNQADLDQYRPVAIVDEKLAATLFADVNPLQQAIYASGNRLIIIGVTQAKSSKRESKSPGTLWITGNYATLVQNSYRFAQLQISPYNLEEIKPLKETIEKVILQRYPNSKVYIYDNADDLIKDKEMQQITTRALTVVGLIALAIGGVGIANITIATVIERTKEIGIRRAIGATRWEIMSQFILEAVILSVLGGGCAIAVIHSITQVATTAIIQVPYTFSTSNAGLSLLAAIGVGVGSSFLPALRATQVDIVRALRGE